MTRTLSPDTAQEKPALRVLRAENPSAMTHTGTMTYLLGQGEVVVIDPGPDLPAHRQAILAALGPDERIAAILLTHGHADHVGGLAALQQATGAPSYGFGPPGAGRSPTMQTLIAAGLPVHGEGFDPAYAPDHRIGEGDQLEFGGITLQVLHLPGHTGCSVGFALGEWLFAGDLAMGWASSLIAPPDGDVTDYLRSLTRLVAGNWSRIFPGHGDAIEDPASRLLALISHRRDREAQILQALAAGPARIPAIAQQIYRDTPARLMPAAERNVLAHLIDLVAQGRVRAAPALRPEAHFRLA